MGGYGISIVLRILKIEDLDLLRHLNLHFSLRFNGKRLNDYCGDVRMMAVRNLFGLINGNIVQCTVFNGKFRPPAPPPFIVARRATVAKHSRMWNNKILASEQMLSDN